MPRDDSAYLLDMLLAARDALSFTEGMSYDDFVFDRRTQLSVLKLVEIVGMRNRLVHVYFDIDLQLVWATVRDDLPAPITLLEPLVPPETEPRGSNENGP